MTLESDTHILEAIIEDAKSRPKFESIIGLRNYALRILDRMDDFEDHEREGFVSDVRRQYEEAIINQIKSL